MASRQSPMSDRSQQDTHLTVHSSSAGRVSSVHSRATPGGATPTGPEQNHPPAPLPSPPFSPPSRKVDDFRHHSRHSSLPYDGTPTPMLQAATPENAKLDVARLLQAENTPPPSTSGAESSRTPHSRSNSVPNPNTHHDYSQSPLHRSTVSASAAIPSAQYSSAPPPLTHQPSLSIPPTSAAPTQRPTLPPIQPPISLPPTQSAVPSSSPYSHWSTPYSAHTPPVHVRPPSPHHAPSKRSAPPGPATSAPPAKRQSKWTPEEDALIIELRGGGMKWEEISKRLPGRSAISCRLHYQNYLERRSEWDEERKNRLARLYERLKPEMWGPLAAELGIPWRAAEAMHWQLGEVDMARRAGVVPFSLAGSSAGSGPPPPPAPPPSAHLYTQTSPEVYGARPVRAGSLTRRPEEYAYPPRPGHIPSGPPPPLPPPSTGAMLPSLAELERGHAAYAERARLPEPHTPRYPSVGGGYERR